LLDKIEFLALIVGMEVAVYELLKNLLLMFIVDKSGILGVMGPLQFK
jgi:hypothetical protein